MPLVTTGELLLEAYAASRAVGAFNVLHLETAEALAAGAESSGLPLILQISQNCVEFHGDLRPITDATLAIARNSTARLAVHIDHAESEELVDRALEAGMSSVMFDASRLPYAQNVARTAAVAARVHRHGATIEAELGEVGGKDGVHAPGVRTDPEEAARFVAGTGIDALAVAVGSSHAMTRRDAQLDHALIRRLDERLDLPLVLHGSSGASDEEIAAAIAEGITKVNVSTHLNAAFTVAVRERLAVDPAVVDSRRYLGAGRTALSAEAARLQLLFAGAEPSRV